LLICHLLKILSVINFEGVYILMGCNVLGLGEGGEIEAQMFSLVQMFNRIPNVQFSTKAPLLPNPCYVQFIFHSDVLSVIHCIRSELTFEFL